MKIRFYFIPIAIILISCASPEPPSGGPPDKTPPSIRSTRPVSGATNFTGNSVRISFDEYMERNKVAESIFISPDVKYELDWSGKSVDIEFKEPLQENTTYAISLGTEYTDLKGNQPTESHTIIFSTGPDIDSGSIAGTVSGTDLRGSFIYGYRLDEMNPDTLDIRHVRPHYRTQIGSGGNFNLMALKPGTYRLFAIDDEFRDIIYSHGTDRFGAAYKDLLVNDTLTPEINIKLGPAIDETGPQIIEVNALNSRRIQVGLSEPVIDTSIKVSSFRLRPRTGSDVEILAAFPDTASMTRVTLITQPLDTIIYELFALPALKDTLGNSALDTMNMTFRGDRSADTLRPAIASFPMQDSSTSIRLDSAFKFIFNTGISRRNPAENITLRLRQTGAAIPLTFTYPNENILLAQPAVILSPDTWYTLSFTSRGMTTITGEAVADTQATWDFETISERTFTSVSGRVLDSARCEGPVRIIFNGADSFEIEAAGDSLRWSMPFMPIGDYSVELYCDSDRNGRYSYGYPFPYRPAEYFEISAQPVSLKSRWAIEDLNFIFRRD